MPDSGLTFSASPRRLKSLDTLRAIAILLMIFSGLLPKTLPNWMDHGYNPHYLPDEAGTWTLRPEVTANKGLFIQTYDGAPWSSFTWVDLVFPMFLFAMGAAIPIAFSRSSESRRSTAALAWHALKRTGMLVLFAVLIRHFSAEFIKSTDPNTARLVIVAAFLLVFLFFVRWPSGTPAGTERTIRIVALVGMLALLVAYAVRTPIPFRWSRSDVIILVLAHTYFVASLVWMFTRNHPGVRLVILFPIVLLAHYAQFGNAALADRRWLGDGHSFLGPLTTSINHLLDLPSWIPSLKGTNTWSEFVAPIFDFSALWNFSWYKFLFVVIPGTLVGDWLRAWSWRRTILPTEFEKLTDQPKVSPLAVPAVVALCIALFIGLRHAGYPLMGVGGPLRTPWLALVLGLPLLALVGWVVLPTAYGSLWIVRRLFYFGSTFLLIGLTLCCLPNFVSGVGFFEGGISKGPPATLSYYFVSVGLCTLLLMALTGMLDHDRRYGFASSILEANGQNPLLAYYLAHTVLGAIMGLSIFSLFDYPYGRDVASIDDYFIRHLLHNPWLLTCWAAAKTLLIAVVVWIFSINRIFWRA